MTTEISLDDLDLVTQSSKAFEFQYVKPDGTATDIYFSVLGGNADAVRTVAEELIDARRRKAAFREMQKAKSGRNTSEPEFDKTADDVAFGQRLAAVRLVGWRGIKEAYTPEGAIKLCQRNPHIAAQIMEQSDDLANFTKN